jgi:hypothetical protein
MRQIDDLCIPANLLARIAANFQCFFVHYMTYAVILAIAVGFPAVRDILPQILNS